MTLPSVAINVDHGTTRQGFQERTQVSKATIGHWGTREHEKTTCRGRWSGRKHRMVWRRRKLAGWREVCEDALKHVLVDVPQAVRRWALALPRIGRSTPLTSPTLVPFRDDQSRRLFHLGQREASKLYNSSDFSDRKHLCIKKIFFLLCSSSSHQMAWFNSKG